MVGSGCIYGDAGCYWSGSFSEQDGSLEDPSSREGKGSNDIVMQLVSGRVYEIVPIR
jgi:hypothetical protein